MINAVFIAVSICSMCSLYIMCVKITKKSRKKNIAGVMEIDEIKTQETATTIATAASDEATIEVMIAKNVSDTGDVSQSEERADDGQSDNERSDAKRTRGKRSKTLKLSKTLKTSKALKGARSLTSEEKAVIIAKAEEIGAAEASREFGINYYTIYTWLKQGKKKASSKSEQSAKPASQTQSKASNRKSGKSSQKKDATMTAQVDEIKEMREIKREYVAEDMSAAPVEAVAPYDKPVETNEQNKPSEITTGKAVFASPAQVDEKQAILIENVILRERISAQKAEIEKLQAAIKSLMS